MPEPEVQFPADRDDEVLLDSQPSQREFARSNLWARVRQTKYMGESLPDKIYGRKQKLARQSILARVRQTKYMGESSPDKVYGREFARSNIWARVRQTKYMGESSPDKVYG